MSIKNIHIKHKIVKGKYLCNLAVTPTPEKSRYLWRHVTCKNCLKRRK